MNAEVQEIVDRMVEATLASKLEAINEIQKLKKREEYAAYPAFYRAQAMRYYYKNHERNLAARARARPRYREYQVRWEAKNRDHRKEYNARYAQENKERIAANKRAWIAANPQKVAMQRERGKIKIAANHEEVAAKRRAWIEANPEKMAVYKERRIAKARAMKEQLSG